MITDYDSTAKFLESTKNGCMLTWCFEAIFTVNHKHYLQQGQERTDLTFYDEEADLWRCSSIFVLRWLKNLRCMCINFSSREAKLMASFVFPISWFSSSGSASCRVSRCWLPQDAHSNWVPTELCFGKLPKLSDNNSKALLSCKIKNDTWSKQYLLDTSAYYLIRGAKKHMVNNLVIHGEITISTTDRKRIIYPSLYFVVITKDAWQKDSNVKTWNQ